MASSPNDNFDRLEDLLNNIDDELNITDSYQMDDEPLTDSKSAIPQTNKAIPLFKGMILYVNELETKAVLKIQPSSPEQSISYKAIEVVDEIKKKGFIYGLIEKNIQKAIQLIKENPRAEVEVVAALGRDPIQGQSSKINYWIGDEDYCKKLGVIQCRNNDLLMRIIPAKSGIPGMRITGEESIPPPVRIFDVKAGQNVLKTPQGEFYSKCAGTVVLKDEELSVFELNRDASASVVVAEDKMNVFLSLEPPLGKGKTVTRALILALLREKEVLWGIQQEVMNIALQQANEKRQPVQNVVIAKGKPPSKGRDASITWYIHPNHQKDRFVINEDGSIDFYNQNNILTVTEGDHLLTLLPATQGSTGKNVLGETLPGKPGTSIRLQAGPNIEQRDDNTNWYAACTGLYRLHHNIIEIQPLYYINGDVDFSVGNIDFEGDVMIAGNVLDGFEVRAKGAICVKGTVEAAILEAGKCIEVTNGIFGKGKGRIISGQNVVSCFLQNANVRAGQDVIAGNQILNSQVYARRNVEVRKGKGCLLGGITVAGSNIFARTIGSDYGSKTVIEVGSDFMTLERMIYINQKEKSLKTKAELLSNIIIQETSDVDPRLLDDDKIQLLENARNRQRALDKACQNLKSEYQALASQLHTAKNPQIITTEMIMPDVLVRIHEERYKFRNPTRQATVGLDPDTGKIIISSRK